MLNGIQRQLETGNTVDCGRKWKTGKWTAGNVTADGCFTCGGRTWPHTLILIRELRVLDGQMETAGSILSMADGKRVFGCLYVYLAFNQRTLTNQWFTHTHTHTRARTSTRTFERVCIKMQVRLIERYQPSPSSKCVSLSHSWSCDSRLDPYSSSAREWRKRNKKSGRLLCFPTPLYL